MNSEFFHLARRFQRMSCGQSSSSFALHRLVAQLLCERLGGIRIPSSPIVLDVASGPGIVFPVFMPVFNPDSYWIFVDLAAGFLREAHRLYSTSFLTSWFKRYKLSCLVADVRELPIASSSVDIVIANLILPCLTNRRRVFREWLRVLKPSGLFLFSCFGPSTFQEIRWAFSFVDSYSHAEFFPDMHDVADELIQEGFQDVVVDMDIKQTIYSDFYSLCRDLKNVGVFYVTSGDKRQGLLSKAAWKAVVDQYELLRHDKGIPLTWELIFGHARKPNEPPTRHEDRSIIRFFDRNHGMSETTPPSLK